MSLGVTPAEVSMADRSPAVRLRVFGGLRAEALTGLPATPIALGGRQERTLLALLAIHRPQPLSGDRLVDLLWPDDAPPTAVKVVQVHVGRLRGSLGADAIERVGDGYRLNDRIGIDVDRFEQFVAEGLAAVADDPLVALDRLEYTTPFRATKPTTRPRARIERSIGSQAIGSRTRVTTSRGITSRAYPPGRPCQAASST
jgi:hypothetical protein